MRGNVVGDDHDIVYVLLFHSKEFIIIISITKKLKLIV